MKLRARVCSLRELVPRKVRSILKLCSAERSWNRVTALLTDAVSTSSPLLQFERALAYSQQGERGAVPLVRVLEQQQRLPRCRTPCGECRPPPAAPGRPLAAFEPIANFHPWKTYSPRSRSTKRPSSQTTWASRRTYISLPRPFLLRRSADASALRYAGVQSEKHEGQRARVIPRAPSPSAEPPVVRLSSLSLHCHHLTYIITDSALFLRTPLESIVLLAIGSVPRLDSPASGLSVGVQPGLSHSDRNVYPSSRSRSFKFVFGFVAVHGGPSSGFGNLCCVLCELVCARVHKSRYIGARCAALIWSSQIPCCPKCVL